MLYTPPWYSVTTSQRLCVLSVHAFSSADIFSFCALFTDASSMPGFSTDLTSAVTSSMPTTTLSSRSGHLISDA